MTSPKMSTHALIPVMAISVFLLLSETAQAQRNPAPPGPIRPAEEMQPASLEERRFRMMEIERQAAEPISEEEQKLALTQIAQDYRELQVINNKMMGTSMPSRAPNFLAISQALDEIRKRAVRLKGNLRLGELKNKPNPNKYKPAENTVELKTQLLSLDDSIMRLVKNPIFKNPDVVNVDEGSKAGTELEYIIATSELIRKDADRLQKYAGKAP